MRVRPATEADSAAIEERHRLAVESGDGSLRSALIMARLFE